ncbi:hypothetical protein BDN72DRAFT_959355 [Pluteus cervinus]|uniref:Uncharacterized protein n=1 Tax=Pluteus cervinus TaxID=181527 RepID=A0ACD3AVI6_9AGAR|nr:hypothetical protein BDN72DRAFT_959355 [Pluteus cervinus]
MNSSFPVVQRSDINRSAISRIDEEIVQLEIRLISLRGVVLDGLHGRKIPNEIDQLQGRILTCKSTRNALVPIAQLHDELLQDIFIAASRTWSGGQVALLVSWICRSWRKLAIQTSTLWSYINFDHPEWVQTALSRTRDHELEFSHSFLLEYPRKFDDQVPIWIENLHRIKGFTLTAFSMQGMQGNFSLGPAWVTPAPCLVELSLDRITLPPNIFSRTCHSLKSLRLTSCTFTWDSIPANPGMTNVSIEGPSVRVPVNNLMTKLRIIAPTLHELCLSDVLLPSPVMSSGFLEPRTPLQHAVLFKLAESHGDPVARLLDQISLPELTNIIVEVSGGTLEDQIATARALVGCRGLESWPVTYLKVDLDEDGVAFHMTEEWEEIIEGTEIVDETSVSLGLHLSGDHSKSSLLSAFNVLPLQPIDALRFEGDDSDHEAEHLEYFTGHTTVQWLEVSVTVVPAFVQAIQRQNHQLREIANIDGIPEVHLVLNEQTTELGLEIMMFPQLQELCLDGNVFGERELGIGHYMELREWLVWRSIFGLRLFSLVLVKLRMPRGSVVWFDDLVDEFTQSGVEEVDEDPDASPFKVDLRFPPCIEA